MSRLGITFEEVVNAAFSIQQNGENPTIDKVRAYLGGTGSNTTISKYLSAWKSQVHLVSDQAEQRPVTPDIVKAAVERVWQEMRESTNAEIEAIKEEAKRLTLEADTKVQQVESIMGALKAEHASLTESYHAVSAEKELALLDLKQLHEEKHLIEERYHGLTQKHEELQRYLTQYANDLRSAHQLEIERLHEAHLQQKANFEKLIDELKQYHESDRHQQMMALDHLRVEQRKQAKTTADLVDQLKDKSIEITSLNSQLEFAQKEKASALQAMADQAAKWSQFDNKTFVEDGFLQKILDMPSLDDMTLQLKDQLESVMETKWQAINEMLKAWLIEKETDIHHEQPLTANN